MENLQTKFGVLTSLQVGVAGGFGVTLRYLFTHIVLPVSGPWLVWLVNMSGSFAIGIAFGAFRDRAIVSESLYAVMAAGFLGGFTTYSALSLDLFMLLKDGRFFMTAFLALVSILGGLLCTFLGYSIMKI